MNNTPYTYLIGWTSLNTWYYGVRFQKNCQPGDFWTTYFTSSKHVRKFIEEHGEPDVKIIRKIFSDSKSARLWEHKVLRRLNARDDLRFLNKTNGDGRFFNSGHTEETKKRLSEKHTGKKLSEETKQKLSKVNKGRLAGERNGMYGKSHTDDAKRKISAASRSRKSLYKGKTYEEIQGSKEIATARKEKHRTWMIENNPFRGKKHSEETKEKMRLKAQQRKSKQEKDIK